MIQPTIALNIFFLFFSLSTQAQNVFIENKGQLPSDIISKTFLPSGELFIEKGVFTYVFFNGKQLQDMHEKRKQISHIDAHAYQVSFLEHNKEITCLLDGQSKYFENYFIGNKKHWAQDVRSYQTLLQQNIYNGIDLFVYTSHGKLKYELIVSPNSNAKKIKIKYTGLTEIQIIDEQLICRTSINNIIEHQPYAYQIIDGFLNEVRCEYKLNKNILSFVFPDGYDKNHELIIDPILDFSTYSGSSANNFGYTATYDDFGFLYSGSTAFGMGYPTTLGAYQVDFAAGNVDIAITKYDTSGTQRIYSTYLGGEYDELPHSMIVNSSEELFVFGTTGSKDFPTTQNAYQNSFKGGTSYSPSGLGASFPTGTDIFVSRINSEGGGLLSSTFLGGSNNDGLNMHLPLNKNYADEIRGEIDIDNNNNIYVATCTKSTDFPITNTFQQNNKGQQEGCIIKIDNQLSTVIWSSYLGGSNHDAIYSLSLDSEDNIFVTGGTTSADFPITTGAYQTNYLDTLMPDAFITHISSEGENLISSTFFGTQNKYDQAYFIELNSNEDVYIFGQTRGENNSLVYNANYFTSNSGQFISVFTKDLTQLLRSTVFGTGKGFPDISPTAFLVDVCGNIYIAGWGSDIQTTQQNDPDPWPGLSTASMQVTANAYQPLTTGHDLYLMVINDLLDSLVYATFFGGDQSREHVDGGTSRFDKKGIIYHTVCAGCGGNSDFPISPNPGAVSPYNNAAGPPIIGSGCNSAVFKFNFDFNFVLADFKSPIVSCNPIISFSNISKNNDSALYEWDFGDGFSSNLRNPTHNYAQPGIYNVRLIVNDQIGCNNSDTIIKKIHILSNSTDTLIQINKCSNESVQIGTNINDPTTAYSWYPNNELSNPNMPNPICSATSSQQYYLLIEKDGCKDTLFQKINVVDVNVEIGPDTSFCDEPILLNAVYNSLSTIVWSSNNNFTDTLSETSNLLVSDTGRYYIISSINSCSSTDSIIVNKGKIELELTSDTTFCDEPILLNAVNNSLNPVIWSSNNNFTDTLSQDSFLSIENTGIYYVFVEKGICFLLDSVIVSSQNIDITLFGNNICQGDSVFVGVKNENPTKPITSYSWTDFESNQSNIFDYPKNSRWYFVEVKNIDDCRVYDSIFITVFNPPIIDTFWVNKDVIYKGDQVVLNLETKDSVIWMQFEEKNNIQVDFPEKTSCYNIQVYNDNCIVSDSICVEVLDVFCNDEEIIIPTAFSPNNDPDFINEKYFIDDKNGVVVEFHLEIFSRLGQKVFYTNDINKKWDGTFKGKEMLPQVLSFFLNLKCIGGKTLSKKGNITIIR